MLVIYHLTLEKPYFLHQRSETMTSHKYITCAIYLDSVDYF